MSGTLPLLTRRGDTLGYDRERGVVRILDRRIYPRETRFIECDDVQTVAQAIEDMIVQGGPPLAYVAGYGLALAARQHASWPSEAQRSALIEATARLRATRPTADDLHHIMREALQRGDEAIMRGESAEEAILRYVSSEVERGDRVAERCGKRAAELLTDGDSILTVCFAGAALNWMLHEAFVVQGKQISIICTETRPYLQGARLAAAQAVEIGVPTTVITDNMPGFCFRKGMITVYITAADRIALDGAAANKVGTYQCAVLARHHKVPFYVLGYDGPDPATPTGDAIPIEERNGDEVLFCAGVRTAAEGARGYYPAFDVTPPELISAIVTDRGIYRPELIARYLSEGEAPLDVLPLSQL
ncbi:MAG: methylthioribose-1-phosphate isomerase [Herpetosiphonaceae bacterium]|nr:MAG: methylthioribose-1-phosphate isomerase [Herpetosiphonaceae bacterium]